VSDDGAERRFPSRYSRQVLFEGIGPEASGPDALARRAPGCAPSARCSVASVRAGVGTRAHIDRDFSSRRATSRGSPVDRRTPRPLPKAIRAERKLRAVNSQVKVEGLVEDLKRGNDRRLLQGFDLILDATDNFDTRVPPERLCRQDRDAVEISGAASARMV